MSIVPSPPANATPTARGLMSAADKAKLDGLSASPVSAVTQANGLTLTAGDLAMGAAGAAAPGAVTTGAQEFGGAKTLTGTILNGVSTIAEAVTSLVRAVGASLVLRSSLGAGASDVAVKVGTSETDAGTNASAKLLSVRTGLGGTEVESIAVLKGGVVTGAGNVEFRAPANYVARVTGNNGGAADNVVVGSALPDASVNVLTNLLRVGTGIGGSFGEVSSFTKGYTKLSAYSGGAVVGVKNTNSAGFSGIEYLHSSDAVLVFTGVQLSTNQFRFNNIASGGYIDFMIAGGTKLRISNAGGIDLSGTDSSGTPGAATINKPTGKSAIASGATSVRITNSLVAAGDQVHITWHGDHGQTRDWVTTGAGFFDVNLNAAATADTAFCWTVSKRL